MVRRMTDTPGLATRFTARFGLSTPIALAPMALAAGGRLAAACAQAGALGLLGGGYADLPWLEAELGRAAALLDETPEARARLGVGFVTWKLAQDPAALERALDAAPAAVMFSFGEAGPLAARVRARGIPVICQVQRIAQLPEALEAGADVIVVQGSEAGGHGMNSRDGRGTFALVPEAADWLAARAPDTLLLAAGGIADGRGLAAALALGADGALIGSRLWATTESLAPPAAQAVAVDTDGDGTARSSVFDILRRKDWPPPYDFRAVRNALHRAWEDRIDALRADPGPARAAYERAVAAADYSAAHVTVGEATGLIRGVVPAAALLADITRTATRILNRTG